MRKLRRLLDLDRVNKMATVECGMTIGQLTRKAAREGLTLFTPTLFPKPTIGGVIATGAHGTDIHTGNFSDQICEMKIVTANGSVRTIGEGHPDFRAAQVALGTLGIVYSVKLKVERDFPVYLDLRRIPVRYVLEEFEDLINSYDFIEIFWYPLQDDMWLYLMYKTGSRPDRPTLFERARWKIRDLIEQAAGEVVLPYIAKNRPGLTPVLSWAASAVSQEMHESVMLASQAFHFQHAYVKNWDMSYAVDVRDGVRAWKDAINLIREYAKADLYPVNLAVHGRFIGKSYAWLAPNYGRRTCQIEVTTALKTHLYREFYDRLEERWLALPDARPHWAKRYHRPREIAARYPKMRAFLNVRQHWDPERIFLNDFLEKVVFQI
jgi:FAD/FMN-containing dehydrogenase